jgi:hypothetical protein
VRERLEASGLAAFLQKPFTPRAIVATIARVRREGRRSG